MPKIATNAAIIVEYRDGSCARINIQAHGYPSWTGELLRTYYADHEAASRLIGKGSLYTLDKPSDWAMPGGLVCLPYTSLADAWPAKAEVYDWVYVHRYGEGWQATKFGIRSLIDLDDLIARYLAEQDRLDETTTAAMKASAQIDGILEAAKHTLAQRCLIHADKMQDEGWYVTANVLWAAGMRIEELEAKLSAIKASVNA